MTLHRAEMLAHPSRQGVSQWILVLSMLMISCRADFFTPVEAPFDAASYGAAAWVDLDNDGDLDLLMNGDENGIQRLHGFENLGAGKFVARKLEAPGFGEGRAAGISVGDLNRDGRLDLGIVWMEPVQGTYFSVWRNLGNWRFESLAIPLHSTGCCRLAFGDFDQDGDLDVAQPYTLPAANAPAALFENRNGSFVELPVGTVHNETVSGWADVDGDGDLDLLGFAFRGLVDVNEGAGRFSATHVGGLDHGLSGYIHSWADADGDGHLDYAGIDVNGRGYLWRDNGPLGFMATAMDSTFQNFNFASWGDFDNDGDPDLFAGGTVLEPDSTRNAGQILANDGAGTMTSIDLKTGPGYLVQGTWGDMDGDGDLDLLHQTLPVGNGIEARTRLLRNDGPVPNTPPSAPTGLSAIQLEDGAMRLVWKDSVDAETKKPRWLTYELRVGTKPGGFEVVAPPSDPVNGRRRVVESGPLRTTLAELRALAKGTYFWSVQAVDAAYAGSAWAVEGTFTVTNTPPTISRPNALEITMSQRVTVEFTVGDAETPASELTTFAESSDADILPPSSWVVSGSGAQRRITLQPASGRAGVVRVTLGVKDSQGLMTRRDVDITVSRFLPELVTLDPSILSVGPLVAGAASDYDGDGSLDLLVGYIRRLPSGEVEAATGILLNDGTGRFRFGPDLSLLNPGWVTPMDVDNDGDLDLLEGGRWHRNEGHGVFATQAPFVVDAFGLPVAIGDFDGDGRNDVVMDGFIPSGSPRLSRRLMRNSSSGFLPGPELPMVWNVPILGSDLDRDGDLDLLYGNDWSNPVTNRVRLVSNQGDGRFVEHPTEFVGVTNRVGYSAWFEDADNDGDVDYVHATDGGVLLFRNQGTGQFEAEFLPVNWLYRAPDLDLDGVPERWIQPPHPFSLPGLPELEFSTPTPRIAASSSYLSTIQLGDFDGDGDVDWIEYRSIETQPGQFQSGLVLLRNQSDRVNRPPTVPNSLSIVAHTADRVTLSWAQSSDDHTPAHFLSYRIRVGSTPGGLDVLSPGAIQAAPGNAGAATFREMRMLRPGTYYWSVQALDGQYHAGPWTPEQSFVVDRPGITSLAEVVVPRGMPSKPIPITLAGDSRTAVGEMVLSATSSDESLIPPGQLVFSGNGNQRSLVITPSELEGETEVLVTATGLGGWVGQWRLHVVVKRFNVVELPEFSTVSTAMIWADYDGDGRKDVLGQGYTYFEIPGGGPLSRMYRNRGLGIFERAPGTPRPMEQGAYFVGDGDGRNQPGLFAVGLGRQETAELLLQESPFGFTPSGIVATNWSTALAAGDRDRDGIPDFLSWGSGQDFVQRQVATSRSNSGRPALLPPEVGDMRVAGMAWADLDGDGDLDLVCSGRKISSPQSLEIWFLGVFENDGRGRFARVESGLPTNMLAVISVADMDGDQLPDIFLSRTGQSPVPWEREAPLLFRNTGGARFERLAMDLPTGAFGVPTWGDADGDGDLDFVLVGHPDTGRIHPILCRNDGGRFIPNDDWFPKVVADQAAWVDANNDGQLDLAVVGGLRDNSPLAVCFNTSTKTNHPPSIPSGLKVTHQSGGVKLAWEAAQDAEDSRYLTYNLRVGTRPGGSEILSALADPATGRRALSGPGNVASLRQRQLNLPDGTYYWAIQSVDAGDAASGFSPEQSITISRPTVQGLGALTVSPNLRAGPFKFTVADVQTSESALIVRAKSSNPAIIPNSAIEVGRSGGQRTLAFTPLRHASGTLRIELEIVDQQGEITLVDVAVTVRAEFNPVPSELPVFGSPAAAWADSNQDGFLDLFVGGFRQSEEFGSSSYTELILNTAGQLLPTPFSPYRLRAVPGPQSLLIQDFDNDGIIDVFSFERQFAGSPRLYLSSSGFSEVATQINGLIDGVAAAADADGDGRVDLFVTGLRNIGGPEAMLYRNLPSQFDRFVRTSMIPTPGVQDGSAAWVDFDSDGDMDLFYTGSVDGTDEGVLAVLLANEGGRFTPVTTGLPGIHQGSVAWADFDRDGHPDLLLSGRGRLGPVTALYRQSSPGVFVEVPAGLPAVANGVVLWGDADTDGWPDFLVSGVPERVEGTVSLPVTSLWFNHRDGTFTRSGSAFPLFESGTAAWGDANRDGAPDLLLMGFARDANCPECSLATVGSVFRNELIPATPPPPPPIQLSTSVDSGDLRFHWEVPPGTPPGLTFNLRVGWSPGGSEILSALADPGTGQRWVAAPGNAGHSGSWKLRGLAGRVLYWSVQSIDAALRASAFAPEQQFDLGNERPTISSIELQSGPMNTDLGPILFDVFDAETESSALVVVASSSNPALIDNDGIAISQVGTPTHQLTLRPKPDAAGSTVITLTAIDPNGGKTQTNFIARFSAVSEVETGFPSILPVSIAPADWNRDGIPEILLTGIEPTGAASGTVWSGFYSRANDVGYVSITVPPFTEGRTRPVWGDFDGDDALDLTVRGAVLRADAGSYSVTLGVTQDEGGTSAWGDYDADGDLDLVQVGASRRSARVLRNEGGAFVESGIQLVPVANAAVAWGDADNDGRLDLAITGRESDAFGAAPQIRLYRNRDGTWIEGARFGGVEGGTLQWVDANRDGRLDVFIAGRHPDGIRQRLFLNGGGFEFIETTPAMAPSGPLPGAGLFDFDNDGDVDLVEHTATALFRIRLNDGAGVFPTASYTAINGPASLLSWTDIDGDGDMDLVTGGPVSGGREYEGSVRVFRNLTLAKPSVVERLTAQVEGNDVVLRWPHQVGFGPGTPVTYNLRVGRHLGTIDVLSPMADSVTGRRRIVGPGNMGFARETRLRGLQRGTYFWSVQAVDSTWKGSPWSPEGTFEIVESLELAQIEVPDLNTPLQTHLEFTAPPGFLVRIEISNDLIVWRQSGETRLGASGRGSIDLGRFEGVMFYRARAVP